MSLVKRKNTISTYEPSAEGLYSRGLAIFLELCWAVYYPKNTSKNANDAS